MCVCVSRPMKIVNFHRKNIDLTKLVLDFLPERYRFRKTMEIVGDFFEKIQQQQLQTLEIVEDFACEARFLQFSSFFFGALAICSSHIRQGVHQNASPRVARFLA